MTRQEFCRLLTSAKQNAYVRLSESLPYILKLSAHKIEAIETGSENFNITDCFHYIKMCGCCLEFEWDFCTELSDLRATIQKTRQESKMSRVDLSIKSGVKSNIISAFEDGCSTLKIDSFLRIADALNATITIK